MSANPAAQVEDFAPEIPVLRGCGSGEVDDPVSAASAVVSSAAATCLLGAPCGRRMPQVRSKRSIKAASRLSSMPRLTSRPAAM